MQPKKATVTHASSSLSNTSSRFVNDEARKRFEHVKINRHPIPERGFNFSENLTLVQFDNEISGWIKLCEPLKVAVVPIVR